MTQRNEAIDNDPAGRRAAVQSSRRARFVA
jgi:hypothetical protein